ncbi:MAG: OpgC domain-containing protein [Pseudoxanthomonas sp.]
MQLPSRALDASSRAIPALDFIRGVCLLVITLNHYSSFAQRLGYDGMQLWTPTNLGYSSAAELFFLISGYLVGAIYARDGVPYPRLFVKLSHRAVLLMLYNVMAFVSLLAFSSVLHQREVVAFGLGELRTRPIDATTDFLSFGDAPPLLNILQLYICFIVVSLVFIPLLRRAPWLALALTCGLYLLNLLPAMQPWLADQVTDWGMNPYAWQLVFFGGLILGRFQLFTWLGGKLQQRGSVSWVFAALIAASVVFVADMKLGLTPSLLRDKDQLGILRPLHAMIVLCVYWVCADLLSQRLSRWGGGLLVDTFNAAGRKSLDNFAFGIALSYAAALLLTRWGNAPWQYFALVAGIVTAFLGFAHYLHWRSRTSTRPIPVAPQA